MKKPRPKPPRGHRCVSVAEYAAIKATSRSTVRREFRSGRLRGAQKGKLIFIFIRAGQPRVTTAQAAELLRIPLFRIRRLCASGQLPAEKFGRNWKFKRSRLLRFRDALHLAQLRHSVNLRTEE